MEARQRGPRGRAAIVLTAVAVLAVPGCSAGGNEAAPSSATQAKATDPPALPSPTPTASAAPKPAGVQLTGWGATPQAWSRTHEQAPGYAAGAVFLPMRDGNPKYATVVQDEHITGYTLNLPAQADLTQAQAEVLGEFPADAHFGRVHQLGACRAYAIISPTLSRAMKGQAPVAYFYSGGGEGTFRSSSVSEVILSTLVEGDFAEC